MRRGARERADRSIIKSSKSTVNHKPIARHSPNFCHSWEEALREGKASLSSILGGLYCPAVAALTTAGQVLSPHHATSQGWCDLEVHKGTPTTFQSDSTLSHTLPIPPLPYTRWRGPYTMAWHKHIGIRDAKVIDLYSSLATIALTMGRSFSDFTVGALPNHPWK